MDILQEQSTVTFTYNFVKKDGNPLDLTSTPDQLKAVFRKPDGSTVDQDASVVGDGSGGQATWKTTLGFLSAGNWKTQGFVEIAGEPYYSAIVDFKVDKNLKIIPTA